MLRVMGASEESKHVMDLQALLAWKSEDPGAQSPGVS